MSLFSSLSWKVPSISSGVRTTLFASSPKSWIFSNGNARYIMNDRIVEKRLKKQQHLDEELQALDARLNMKSIQGSKNKCNKILIKLLQQNREEDARLAFRYLLTFGREKSLRLYTHEWVMKWLARRGRLQFLMEFYNLLKEEIEDNVRTRTLLLLGHAKGGDSEGMMRIFSKMSEDEKDVRVYNTVVRGFAQVNDLDSALKYYNEMIKRGIQPNQSSLCCLMGSYVSGGRFDKAEEIFAEIKQKYKQPSPQSYAIYLKSIRKSRDLKKLQAAFDELDVAYPPHRQHYNHIIEGAFEMDDMRLMQRYFDRMIDAKFIPSRDKWEKLLIGYAKLRDLFHVLENFDKMQKFYNIIPGVEACKEVLKYFGRDDPIETSSDMKKVLESMRTEQLLLRKEREENL